MALTVKGGFRDIEELRADLDGLEVGLGGLVAKVGRRKLGPLIAEVQELLPHDPTHRGWRGFDEHWNADEDPGHISESIHGGTTRTGFTISTSHPGGPVHWWGGTIRPQQSLIEIHHLAGAGEDFTSKTAEEVGRDVENALDDLARRHNL